MGEADDLVAHALGSLAASHAGECTQKPDAQIPPVLGIVLTADKREPAA
jgi:predicted alpha/beta hydrolase family esterase